jgi:hypothetical protein
MKFVSQFYYSLYLIVLLYKITLRTCSEHFVQNIYLFQWKKSKEIFIPRDKMSII